MTLYFKSCAKCTGTMQQTEDGKSCLICGTIVYDITPDATMPLRRGGTHTYMAKYNKMKSERE